MKTALLSVVMFLATSSFFASADGPLSIRCSSANSTVDVTITLPANFKDGDMIGGATLTGTVNGTTLPSSEAVVLHADAQVLQVESQIGYACEIDRVSGGAGSFCAYVASQDTQTYVSCQ